ncbi:MAG TPA: tetratricopeptide repeat protein, partial [Candidatus Polarisedimenticolia bacterium]|nr:tetratricopeptide repeat protein [Candidatus Polarisedimenticolia bacterium]
AVAAFEKAIELDPKMGEVYNNLGFLYHTTLKYDRALEMFNQAIQTSSDSAVAYINLGNTYYKMSRHEQAVAAWKRALELDPLNENARRCLRMYQQENA